MIERWGGAARAVLVLALLAGLVGMTAVLGTATHAGHDGAGAVAVTAGADPSHAVGHSPAPPAVPTAVTGVEEGWPTAACALVACCLAVLAGGVTLLLARHRTWTPAAGRVPPAVPVPAVLPRPPPLSALGILRV